jgi:hypothetical protein
MMSRFLGFDWTAINEQTEQQREASAAGNVVRLISLLAGRFYRDFYRASYVESFDAGIYFTDWDDARVGNLLAVIPVIDSHIRSGRPITYVPDLI